MDNINQRIEALKARKRAVKKWKKRIQMLRNRDDSPLSERAFCAKYKIPHAAFNRQKNFAGAYLPNALTIEKVERAFKKEGV